MGVGGGYEGRRTIQQQILSQSFPWETIVRPAWAGQCPSSIPLPTTTLPTLQGVPEGHFGEAAVTLHSHSRQSPPPIPPVRRSHDSTAQSYARPWRQAGVCATVSAQVRVSHGKVRGFWCLNVELAGSLQQMMRAGKRGHEWLTRLEIGGHGWLSRFRDFLGVVAAVVVDHWDLPTHNKQEKF